MALRGATHQAHQSLDRRLDLQQLTSTRDRYVGLLRATLAVMTPLEEPGGVVAGATFDWAAGCHLRTDRRIASLAPAA